MAYPGPIRRLSSLDRLLSVLGRGLVGAVTAPAPGRANPANGMSEGLAGDAEAGGAGNSADEAARTVATDEAGAARRHAAGLMRVDHVGEVCAQALYEGHALTVDDPALSAFFLAAADEERDHLAWTAQRLAELGARPSVLLPVWYLGSLGLGALAGLGGRQRALGFMAETERQVEAHLQDHLDRLPPNDGRSRAIVAQMKADEARHALKARDLGGSPMPAPVRAAMRLMSKVMTTVAYRL